MTSAPTHWTCQCGVQVPMGCLHTCGPFPPHDHFPRLDMQLADAQAQIASVSAALTEERRRGERTRRYRDEYHALATEACERGDAAEIALAEERKAHVETKRRMPVLEANSPAELDAVFYAMNRSDCRSFVPRLRATIAADRAALTEERRAHADDIRRLTVNNGTLRGQLATVEQRLAAEQEETRRERTELIEALAAVHVALDEMEEECRYWQDRTNQYGGPE